jgi:hypothetical protein
LCLKQQLNRRYCSRFWRRVDAPVDANVSEKYTVSIFRAEVAILGSGGIYIGLEEEKVEGVAHSYIFRRVYTASKPIILTAVKTSNLTLNRSY